MILAWELGWSKWISLKLLVKLSGIQREIISQLWHIIYRLVVRSWSIACQKVIQLGLLPRLRELFSRSVSTQLSLISSLVHTFKFSNIIYKSRKLWLNINLEPNGSHLFQSIQAVIISSLELMIRKLSGSIWIWGQKNIRIWNIIIRPFVMFNSLPSTLCSQVVQMMELWIFSMEKCMMICLKML